jgi:hypothetical protein
MANFKQSLAGVLVLVLAASDVGGAESESIVSPVGKAMSLNYRDVTLPTIAADLRELGIVVMNPHEFQERLTFQSSRPASADAALVLLQ